MNLFRVLKNVLASEAMRPVLLIAIILVGWDLGVRIFRIPPYLVPSPTMVVGELIAHWPMLLRETLPTLYATLGGFLLSVLFGIPVAILIASSRTVESYVYPILVFSQSVPKIAVAPLFVVWFGFGILPKIIAAFLLGFFPVVVATVIGLKSIETDMLDLARSMRAGALRTFLHVRLPYALPSIFGGLKVSITLAVVGAVVGEFVGSNSGIGYVLQVANGNFDLPLMFAALFILSMMGVVLFMLLDFIEHLSIPWHASRRGEFALTA